VRLAGTALICVVAAFGAAFLVARAADHQTPAKAATTLSTQTTEAEAPVNTTANAELVSEFTPSLTSLKPKPRPHHRRHHSSPPPAASSASSGGSGYVAPPTDTAPAAPTNTAPVYTPPNSGGGGTGSSGGHHSGGGGGGGSGTITIGG
jgi:hypothetical protein